MASGVPVLVEGFVVAATRDELERLGWQTTAVVATSDRGGDIIARRDESTLRIEAKGAGSSAPGPADTANRSTPRRSPFRLVKPFSRRCRSYMRETERVSHYLTCRRFELKSARSYPLLNSSASLSSGV